MYGVHEEVCRREAAGEERPPLPVIILTHTEQRRHIMTAINDLFTAAGMKMLNDECT